MPPGVSRRRSSSANVLRRVDRRPRDARRHAAQPDRHRLHPPRGRRRAAVLHLDGARPAGHVRPARRGDHGHPGRGGVTRGARLSGVAALVARERPRARPVDARPGNTLVAFGADGRSSGCCPALVALVAGEQPSALPGAPGRRCPRASSRSSARRLLFVLPADRRRARVHAHVGRRGADRLVDRLPLRRRHRARRRSPSRRASPRRSARR